MATEKTEQELKDKPEAKQPRKIIQISTSTTNTGRIVVTALCNDGTVWHRDVASSDEMWRQIKGM